MSKDILDYLNGVEPYSEEDMEMMSIALAEHANSYILGGGLPEDAMLAARQYYGLEAA